MWLLKWDWVVDPFNISNCPHWVLGACSIMEVLWWHTSVISPRGAWGGGKGRGVYCSVYVQSMVGSAVCQGKRVCAAAAVVAAAHLLQGRSHPHLGCLCHDLRCLAHPLRHSGSCLDILRHEEGPFFGDSAYSGSCRQRIYFPGLRCLLAQLHLPPLLPLKNKKGEKKKHVYYQMNYLELNSELWT